MREDVQKARAERLAEWREKNPEKFRSIVTKMQRAKRSKSSGSKFEDTLAELLPNAKRNSQVRCGVKLKQVDFALPGLWVEVDGHFHFFPVYGQTRLDQSWERDAMLNREAVRRGIALVRIGLDCFTTGGMIRARFAKAVQLAIAEKREGLTCIGDLYRLSPWERGRWWTSKSAPRISSR